MPGNTFGTGSTGTQRAERIRQLFYNFTKLPVSQQTSAQFNDDWTARTTRYLDVALSYSIPGQFGSNSSSWFRYHKERYGSTHDATAAKQPSPSFAPHTYGLPSPTIRDFTTRSLAYSTLGNSDAAIGRRTFDLWSTNSIYRDEGFEFLLAWSGRGVGTSAGVGSSVRLV